jgi:hypothetical protein
MLLVDAQQQINKSECDSPNRRVKARHLLGEDQDMATLPGDLIPVYSPARIYREEQRFFVRFALTIAGVILFGFAQWAARGMVNVGTVPLWVHLHGGLMVSWLGLFATQALLAQAGSRELHRRLGLASLGVLAAIVLTGFYTAMSAVELHRVPPFFTDAYFLALSTVGTMMFAALVLGGIAKRRQGDWHRRLMLGSGILLLEPALGRLLPMPLLGPWGPFIEMCLQLCFVLFLARHDMHRRGMVHPATLVTGFAVIATLFIVTMLSIWPPFVGFASSVAGGL